VVASRRSQDPPQLPQRGRSEDVALGCLRPGSAGALKAPSPQTVREAGDEWIARARPGQIPHAEASRTSRPRSAPTSGISGDTRGPGTGRRGRLRSVVVGLDWRADWRAQAANGFGKPDFPGFPSLRSRVRPPSSASRSSGRRSPPGRSNVSGPGGPLTCGICYGVRWQEPGSAGEPAPVRPGGVQALRSNRRRSTRRPSRSRPADWP
jgi:hypothetical protein